jgi:hypothetical protein
MIMTVHFSEGHFEIIVIKIRSCYYLTLSIIKLEDFIYYVFYLQNNWS